MMSQCQKSKLNHYVWIVGTSWSLQVGHCGPGGRTELQIFWQGQNLKVVNLSFIEYDLVISFFIFNSRKNIVKYWTWRIWSTSMSSVALDQSTGHSASASRLKIIHFRLISLSVLDFHPPIFFLKLQRPGDSGHPSLHPQFSYCSVILFISWIRYISKSLWFLIIYYIIYRIHVNSTSMFYQKYIIFNSTYWPTFQS